MISCIACLDSHLPTPTWQWVTLAPIFGSFILYLLVNKIRVFRALVNETAYSCGRFSIFVVWFLAYYYILLKSLQKVGIPAQIVNLLLSFLFAVYLLLPPITQVFIIGAFLMLCLHVISWKKQKLSTDNRGGCRQYFVCRKWSSFSTGGRRSWNNHAFVGVLAPPGYLHLSEL